MLGPQHFLTPITLAWNTAPIAGDPFQLIRYIINTAILNMLRSCTNLKEEISNRCLARWLTCRLRHPHVILKCLGTCPSSAAHPASCQCALWEATGRLWLQWWSAYHPCGKLGCLYPSLLHPVPTLAMMDIWEMNQETETLLLFVSQII